MLVYGNVDFFGGILQNGDISRKRSSFSAIEPIFPSSIANTMEDKGGEKQDNSIDKLCEIFSKIIEQPRVNPKIFKYALEPNPVKLSGPENYVSWARQAKLILGSHGYEKLLIATDGEEEKGSGSDTKQINDRVLVWLLGSMESTIREQVETMETVAKV